LYYLPVNVEETYLFLYLHSNHTRPKYFVVFLFIYLLYFSFYRQCVECVNQSKQCLEKTEGEIKNEQPRDIGNIGHTRRKTKKTNTT